VSNWEDLKLSAEALNLIQQAGYAAPSPIQMQCIPVALEGSDVIGTAQTGTGKTAAFTLPMVERFAGRKGTYGLVLSPTREIAQQTQATFEKFGKPRGVESVVLIGGVNMREDDKALATYPQVIVATPGRLCDHLDRGNIWLDFIEVVVLDEADRMLDMGFTDQLNRVMQDVPPTRQTLLFSATMTPSVEKLARKIMHEPVRIAIGAPATTATAVEQYVRFVTEEQKNTELRRIIREETGSIIVFTRSKIGATKVWRSLHSSGIYDATYIHSDRLQSHREQALAEFKEGKYRILIATDVAGRGIHVEGVAHVVNYDLPMEPEDYVHRIGRTGRAGASGRATTFITPRDKGVMRQIEKLIGRSLVDAPSGPAREPREPSREKGENARMIQPLGAVVATEPPPFRSLSEAHGEATESPASESGLDALESAASMPVTVRVISPVVRGSAAPAAVESPEGEQPGRRRRRRGRGQNSDSVSASPPEELPSDSMPPDPLVSSSVVEGELGSPTLQNEEEPGLPTHYESAATIARIAPVKRGDRSDRPEHEGASRDRDADREWESARRQQKTFFPIDEPPPPPLSARGLYAGTSTPWSTKSSTPWRPESPESDGEESLSTGGRPVPQVRGGGSGRPGPGPGSGQGDDEARRGRRRRGRSGRGRSSTETGPSNPVT
jgi:ATP-dependent RNA helicase RhlE